MNQVPELLPAPKTNGFGPFIEMRNVVKYYGDTLVLDEVSFKVQQGETKIIIGGSGSGKSTILKLIMGLEKPDEGQIFIEGQEITKLSETALTPIRQNLGMVFQESALFDSMSVRENVAFRYYEEGAGESEIDADVRRVLGFVGLEDAIDKYPSELSGGMKRRVALARALISNPKFMLYDEPTAGLDPITSRKINELIIALRDLLSVSGIFVTHRLRDAFTLATVCAFGVSEKVDFRREDGTFCISNTKFLLLREGKIIFEGPDEILRKSEDPYIRRFLA